VVLEHATGNAQAIGDVKAEYTEAASASGKSIEPMHVLAERADVDHATGVVTFHGAPVRMWQGGSQVQAPLIEVGRTPKRLVAHGENGAPANTGQVHTVLMNANGTGGAASHSGAAAGSAQPCATNARAGKAKPATQQVQSQVVRVTSGGLAYSDALHEVDFTDGFRAEMADGTVRANAGAVYLKEPKSVAKADAGQSGPVLAGDVDRIVASGQIAMDRPGLRASGERLVYTAADESLLLTGDGKNPPKARDARGNVTTGAALEFHRACGDPGGDTVEVLNSVPGGPLGVPLDGVHTEVQADAKREKPRR
ncbi:MAG TPA: LptA/OstA family protein, partial [Acidobacteriaceae bacterium]